MGPAAELSAPAPAWSFACPDWVDRLKARRSLVPDLPLDTVEAARAVGIFNALRLPDVPGQPAMAEAAGDWFRDIVRAAFGSLDKVSGRRRVAEIFALVPKKNNKTTGGAAIMLTALLMNKRPNAELLFVGPTQEISFTAFDAAAGMIAADPEGYLEKRFHVQHHNKTIVDRITRARLKVKTFDMKVMTGSKPVIVLIDELHVMSAYSYASRVVGQIRGGMIANPESLLIFITTQSDTAPAGVFASELGYARKVRDGEIVDNVRTLPILYEFPPEIQRDETEPWRDPAMWSMVNPNLGLSITLDRLIDGFNQAVEKGAAALREWASQHLNIEIGLALSQTAWVGALYWERAADPTLTLATLLARCEVATVGVDGGGLDDLLGLAVLGRERETRRWLCWARAWAFVSVLERRQSEAERLRSLAAAGDLTIFERMGQDTEEMIGIVRTVEAAGLLANVGADRIGVDFSEELNTLGVKPGERLFGIPQGYMLMGAIKTVERKLADGTFRHAGQPLMAWSVGNAKVEPRGNAVMITKQAAGTAKIDPLMALFDAVYLMSKNPTAPRKPEYQMIVV